MLLGQFPAILIKKPDLTGFHVKKDTEVKILPDQIGDHHD
jgi:hypothetical protein